MKVRVYSHGSFKNKYMPEVPEEMYVELDLANYTRKDIERVGGEHFTACGKNCFLVVDYMPENDKEEKMVRSFRWHNSARPHWFTIQADYAVKNEGDKNRIMQSVNEETMNNLDKCLTDDRKVYTEWMKNN